MCRRAHSASWVHAPCRGNLGSGRVRAPKAANGREHFSAGLLPDRRVGPPPREAHESPRHPRADRAHPGGGCRSPVAPFPGSSRRRRRSTPTERIRQSRSGSDIPPRAASAAQSPAGPGRSPCFVRLRGSYRAEAVAYRPQSPSTGGLYSRKLRRLSLKVQLFPSFLCCSQMNPGTA